MTIESMEIKGTESVTHWHNNMGRRTERDEMVKEEGLCAKNGQSVSERYDVSHFFLVYSITTLRLYMFVWVIMNSPGLQAGEHEQPPFLSFSLPHLPPAGRQVGEGECVCLLTPKLKPGAIHHKRYSKVVM